MSRTINEVFYNNTFIKHVDAIRPLTGKWVHNADAPTCDLSLLDNYIKMQIGRSRLHKFVDNDDIYNTLRTVIESNNYRLEKNWESVLAEFNPIENYDRYEDSTINDTVNTAERKQTMSAGEQKSILNVGEKKATVSAGEHKTITNIGEREQTNSNGEQTNTSTSENKTTPFDAGDYSKATDKNTTTSNSESYTDTIHTDEATDTTTQNAYTDTNTEQAHTDTTTQNAYTDVNTEQAHTDTETHTTTSHIHGNIGVVDAPTMLEKFRAISNYNFFDVVVNIIEEYITEMNYESEEF